MKNKAERNTTRYTLSTRLCFNFFIHFTKILELYLATLHNSILTRPMALNFSRIYWKSTLQIELCKKIKISITHNTGYKIICIFDNIVQTDLSNDKKTFGEYIRRLKEERSLPLKKCYSNRC